MKQDVKMLIMMVYDGDNTKTRYGHLAEWELIQRSRGWVAGRLGAHWGWGPKRTFVHFI